MSFTNITDEELEGLGVTGLPDTPGMTTEEMQEQFDEYPKFLKDKFRTLISELEAVTGALNIGAEVPENITADGNIQSILNGLRKYVDDTVIALGTGDMATGIYDPNRDGIIAPGQGGTGQTSLQATRNAMGLGNTSGALPIANGGTGATTVAEARNALGLGNTAGALPITNGGTGQTTAAGVRNALGLGNTTGPLPITNGGTGKSSITSGTVLVGNGSEIPTERAISEVGGGVENSKALTTAGALFATKAALQLAFQAGVDAVYNACIEAGITPSSSTPEGIATAIVNAANGTATAADIVAGKTALSGKRLLTGTRKQTETYTFPANDTGGTKDLGEQNFYRYVNAANVYNKGYATPRTWWDMGSVSVVAASWTTEATYTLQIQCNYVGYYIGFVAIAYNLGYKATLTISSITTITGSISVLINQGAGSLYGSQLIGGMYLIKCNTAGSRFQITGNIHPIDKVGGEKAFVYQIGGLTPR